MQDYWRAIFARNLEETPSGFVVGERLNVGITKVVGKGATFDPGSRFTCSAEYLEVEGSRGGWPLTLKAPWGGISSITFSFKAH